MRKYIVSISVGVLIIACGIIALIYYMSLDERTISMENKDINAQMFLFEYPTQYAQVSDNHFYYLRKKVKGGYILYRDGSEEILSFHLQNEEHLRGFVVCDSQYYFLLRNKTGTLQLGKIVGPNNDVKILCDVYAKREINSLILHENFLFVCERDSNKIERQSMQGEIMPPIQFEADSDVEDMSIFGSEEMDGICIMDVDASGEIEITVIDWQGNRKKSLQSQMKLYDNGNLQKGRGVAFFQGITKQYIYFSYYYDKKSFAGRMTLGGKTTEILKLGSREICDTSFTGEGVYFVSENKMVYHRKWRGNQSERLSDLQAESIYAAGEWLYVKKYTREWEMLEDGEEEATDEWSDELYRINRNDRKIERIAEGDYSIFK